MVRPEMARSDESRTVMQSIFAGQVGLRVISIVAFFLVWGFGSLTLGPRLCPDPFTVLAFAGREIASGELPYHLAITLARVVAGVSHRHVGRGCDRARHGAERVRQCTRRALADPALQRPGADRHRARLYLDRPERGRRHPRRGAEQDPERHGDHPRGHARARRFADGDGEGYRFSRAKTLRHVILPQLQPYIAASARSGLALIWKIVLVVELLGRSNGIGFKIHLYFQVFDVRAILAYTLVFVGVMLPDRAGRGAAARTARL